MNIKTILFLIALTIYQSNSVIFSQNTLPEGFSYLFDVDPSILQSVRYAQPINFVG